MGNAVSSRKADRNHGSALDALPAAFTVAYAVLAVHGLFLLAGMDMTLWGPALTPEQCFLVSGLYLTGKLFRRPPPPD